MRNHLFLYYFFEILQMNSTSIVSVARKQAYTFEFHFTFPEKNNTEKNICRNKEVLQ